MMWLRSGGYFVLAVLTLTTGAAGQDERKPTEQPKVARDEVKGSIHHHPETVWKRVAGRVKVIDAGTWEFGDGTQVTLNVVTLALSQMGWIYGKLSPCGKEAAEFVRKHIGDREVTVFMNEQGKTPRPFLGDESLENTIIINGWGLAYHSHLHAPEMIAREKKRGLWRGEFVNPAEWRDEGKRLPGEK